MKVMKNKIFCLLSICLLVAAFAGHALSNGSQKEDIEISSQKFITQLYKHLVIGSSDIVSQYFEVIDERQLSNLIQGYRNFPIDRIEFLETNILSKEPLMIEVLVKEWYTNYPPPYLETLFILKNVDVDANEWKIIDITEPAL